MLWRQSSVGTVVIEALQQDAVLKFKLEVLILINAGCNSSYEVNKEVT